MLNVDVIGNKKRKRCGRVFRFKNFGEPGYPVEFKGPFRENVNALLEFAKLETKLGFGMPIWSFQLELHRHPPSHVFLFVIEEAIEASPNPHCNQCQYVGWGNHFICNKKYHFLLPSKETLAACLSFEVPCGAIAVINNNNGKSKLIELQGHMMQGVFHSNGFGHLLCVNGLETGSDLAGHQIMEFWDRLCTGLQARKVSLNDIAQKRGMELRLINGIAHSEPWFGKWGYKFGRGCFGVTQSTFQKAIEAIRSIPLYLLIHHINGNSSYHDIPMIFSRYQTLSNQSIVTLGDLFHFMLELKSRLPQGENFIDSSHNTGILFEPNCRWSPKRIEMATRVIVEALKRAEFRWISRQEVRDAARSYIGDTGLLDFVLKSLGNHIVGNYLVRRSLNPVTKVLEYCLEDISNVFPSHHHLQEGNLGTNNSTNNRIIKDRYKITRAQVMKDMFYLYKYILKDPKPTQGSILSAIPLAARIILDTKYLIKEYFGELPFQVDLGLEGKLSVFCTIMLRNNYNNNDPNEASPIMPPYECITLKSNATMNELKVEVERNFREIYWGLRSFCGDSIKDLEIANWNDMVFGMVEVGGKIMVEGMMKINNNNNNNNLGEMYEGNNNYCCEKNSYNGIVVDCNCGTKEDDGERMVCCDICETWQHTRCVRIPNDEQVPSIFLCKRCEQEIVMFPSLP